MTFQTLFEHYYSLYRGDSEAPASTDPEWVLAWRYYNDALNRMSKMDDTKWNFLFSTLGTTAGTGGITTLTTGTRTYACPNDMSEPGGYVTFIDSNNNHTNYQVVQPHQIQTISTSSQVAWFTGDEQRGFTLHLNVAPTSTENGRTIDYTYYRKPTYLISTESGSTVIEGGDPAYYYNHMLAQRFRNARNYPSYQTALRDSEEALKGMKLKNNSGGYYNSWNLLDNNTSSSGFGV